MLKKIQAYIKKHGLLEPDAPLIVGLSGGADSVALLTVLKELGYSCIAAHCNFKLRGEESDRDEGFAEALAQSLAIPFHKITFKTAAYASENHISIEMAARQLRYQWFEKLRSDAGAQAIAVAHHKDDNVETLIMNLTRGTGLRGLRGMNPKNGYVVRPLLGIDKEEILAWIELKGLNFVTDSTNLADLYSRNFIRLRIIPLLETINPSVKEALTRTIEHISSVEQIYQSVIDQAKEKIVTDGRIDIEELCRFPAPETILYELLSPYAFSRQRVEDLFRSLDKESGKTFYSSTHRIVTAHGCLLISPLGDTFSQTYTIKENDAQLDCGEFKLSLSKISVDKNFKPPKEKNAACLDCDKLEFPLTVRRWKAGDSFVPFGMKGRKKISDLFTDLKYSLADKEKAWLVCSGQDIVWVAGERIDNRYRIDKSASTAYLMQINRRQ